MPDPGNEASACGIPATRQVHRTAGTAAPDCDGGALHGARKPKGARNGAQRGPAGRRTPEAPGGALHGLLHGLRAGDLESVLLTVAMAAEENRMPSADPDEAARILGFLARLAEHDATLPPPPDGSGGRPEEPLDGIDAGDGPPAR